MKKSILVSCTLLAAFSLTAFSYINWNNSYSLQKNSCKRVIPLCGTASDNTIAKHSEVALVYAVEPRFNTRITREKLQQAASIIDILPKSATEAISIYNNVRITAFGKDSEITEIGQNEILNSEQLKLIQSLDYSTDFRITSDCQVGGAEKSNSIDYDLVYYMTIIPERETYYQKGHDALISYLKEKSADATKVVTKDKLKPGKLVFTVNRKGNITNVNLNSTSGYNAVDDKMIELISNLPGKWIPASNSKGEAVDQELVFFFGVMGC